MGEVRRQLTVKGQPLPCGRMDESQRFGMEALAVKAGDAVPGPIDGISCHRMMNGCHMNADLVRSAGFQLTFNICVVPESLKYLIVGDSPAAVDGFCAHLFAVHGMPSDRRINGSLVLLQISMDDRVIASCDGMFF